MKRNLLIIFILMIGLLVNKSTAQNLVTNGGFETWVAAGGGGSIPSGWTIANQANGTVAQNAVLFNEGSKSCKINAITGNYTISQAVSVTVGKTYTFRVSYYIETAAGTGKDARLLCYFRKSTNAAISTTLEDSVSLRGPGGITGAFTSSTGAWKTYTYDVVAPTGATSFYFSVAVLRGATVSWDNFSLTENTSPTIFKYTYDATNVFNYSPALSGFAYTPGNGPSTEQAFGFRASNLTGPLTVTAPANYEISASTGSLFSGTSTLTVPQTAGLVNPITLHVRLKSGLTAGTYIGSISLSSNGATTQAIPLSGTVSVPPVTITLSGSTLGGFTYSEGSGPSPQQSFTVTGSNLTAGIVITAPANFELSALSGTSFTGTASISIPQTNGSVAKTTIYVRLLSGLTFNTYGGNITVASTGGTTQNIALTGTVSSPPGINVSTTGLIGLSYYVGAGPSAIQSFTVAASNLTTYVIISAPADFEISTDTGSSFTATGQILLPPSNGTVAATPIYVRLKSGLAVKTFSESATVSSTGFTSKSVSLTGDVLMATGTENVESNVLKVYTNENSIFITGVRQNEKVTVYTTLGMLVKAVKSTGEPIQLSLPRGAVYMIHTADKTIKVIF